MTAVGRVVYSLKVNGVKVPDTPCDFELRQEWGCHDLVFVRIVVNKGRDVTGLLAYPDGAAVEMTWGRYPTSVTSWYGYVNHHVIATDDDESGQNVQITYVLIGTSKPMNADRSHAWTGMTGPAIAQNIARQYGLRCVVTSSGWVLPYETQANESDFQFLNRIAEKIGYRFWVSGGTLYFLSPVILLSGKSPFFVPTYSINKLASVQDTASNFEVIQGDSVPGAYQMPQSVFGIDVSTGRVYQATADNSPGTGSIITSDRYASSRGEAKRLVNASQALGQFSSMASAEVFGYSYLYPGKVIGLTGRALPNHNSGQWMVTSARHVLKISASPNPTADRYVTRLLLVRNLQAPSFAAGTHRVTPELMPCVLAGGRWRAKTLGTVIEGSFG